jgi:8-oxo-dGTP pyrophosphatase MutT (NUDIX family)
MGKKDQVPAEPDREPRAQYAALPWRRDAAGRVEVLLITSRETRRWVIPKGWPIKGLTSPQSAAREAFEEAGVEGDAAKSKLGTYTYDKRLRSGRMQAVRVTVYALKVATERDTWPEKGQREKLWIPPAEAAQRVDEPDLRALIAAFKPRKGV